MWSGMITATEGGEVIHRGVSLSNLKFNVTMDGGTLTADLPQRSFGAGTIIQYTDLPGPELDELTLDVAVLDPQVASRVPTTGRPIITEESYEPRQRVLWVCWNGQPYCPFTIMGVAAHDPLGATVQVYGKRSDVVMMEGRTVRHNIQFVSVDQFRVFKDLFDYGAGRTTSYSTAAVTGSSAAVAQGSWMSVTWETLSGVAITRRIVPGNNEDGYPANGRKYIESALMDLLHDVDGVNTGFERRFACSLNTAGDPVIAVELGYPRVGYTDPKVVFEYPSNAVMSCLRSKDGTNFATRVDYTGQETNGSRPIGTALDRTALNAGYPLIERVFAASDVSKTSTLNAKATARLTGKVPTNWQVTLNPLMQPSWGSYRLGDHVQLRLRTDPVQEHLLRIIGIAVDVAPDGQAVVTPTLQAGDEVEVE